MIIKQDGKELKNALVRMDASGKPSHVVPDPKEDKSWQPAKNFTFEEPKTVKKTKDAPKKKTK